MSLTVGKYTFSAWLRRGIGRTITETDTLGAADGVAIERATVPIDVQVNTQAVHKEFALLGPGDVIGIAQSAVVRTEPPDWVTDFEPNYLAFIEFYDEDFLWRHTPASPAGNRLRPWLALAVLEEDDEGHQGEFVETKRKLPLPSIQVASTASLPPLTQSWAWAHVHTNDSFDDETDFEKFLESLEAADNRNADRIISRLASPRRLKPNTAYRAFVVPALETGRVAGLGEDPKGVPAQKPAWSDAPGAVELPVFFYWRFRTGEAEDFESMVKRLEPKTVDARVGIRDMDGEQPGWGLTAGTDIGQIVPADLKQTVIGLEGALKAPSTKPKPPTVDTTRPFFAQLQSILNAPAQRLANTATAALPVVAPPIYGEHHAQQHTIDVTRGGWVNALNRDPRTRLPSGFGVSVVRENQESYVARAWTQVEAVLAANRAITLAAYAMRVGESVYQNLAANFSAERTVAFFSPLLRKVRGSPTTLQHLMNTSTLPHTAVSGAMRRLIRPRGTFARRVAAADSGFTHDGLVHRMANGSLTAAPPKTAGDDLATDETVVTRLPSGSTRPAAAWSLWVAIIVVALLLLIGFFTGAWLFAVIAIAITLIAYVVARQMSAGSGGEAPGAGPTALADPTAVAAAVQGAAPRSAFRFVETDPVVAPRARPGTQMTTAVEKTSTSANAVTRVAVSSRTAASDGGDTAEASAFRTAAAALERRLGVTPPVIPRATFDLAGARAKLAAAVDPLAAFPRRVASGIRLSFAPSWLLQPEHLVPAMAYPDFDDPMYEKLRDLSSELLLPNLNLIPPNSITLLQTNPAFIEAYLVGLNYEFGKELLWREYPTDRRGSYFRQFWDVRGIIAEPTGEDAALVSERAKDITPLDTWTVASSLGSHRNPLRPPAEQIVLTIRGDLLKKYPNTLIYAQKAHIARDSAGRPEPSSDPVIATVETDADVQREIRFPAFKASVDPDIKFYGFDLTVDQARGASPPQAETDDWGYYFVIQQLPGEPRFGMDLAFSPDDDPATPITWNDLAWSLFPDGQTFVDTEVPPQSFVPAGPGEALTQWGSDSARMASILLQAPVMIAVHAKEMLEDLA
jgi:hypothetical protein